jgi:hypothetical protein
MTSAGAANAFSVGFSIGMDRGYLSSGASLDAAIDGNSLVTANAGTTTGPALAVASNDANGLTGLSDFRGTEAVSLAVQLGLDTESIASTTTGSAEAVGWMGSTGLENTSVLSSGLGLIEIGTNAANAVQADAVSGAVNADAFSSITGISATNFSFADTSSEIAVDLASDTKASASSVLGNAISNLTSSVLGLFGQGTQNQITGVQSVDAVVADQGFSEAASIGGSAAATANQSIAGISGYNLTTTDDILIRAKSNLDSTSTASVTEA